MNQPKVLIVQRILPPYRLAFFQKLSASEIMNMTLAYGQASVESGLESLESPAGVRIERLGNAFWGKNERIIRQRGLSKLVRSRQYDTLIAEFNPRIVTNLLAMRQAKKQRVKFIWWGHGIRPSGRQVGFYRHLATQADALIFYSQEGKDRFIELGIPAEKLFVAWNSIDTEEIGKLTEARPFAERKRILCISRLIAEKKVDLLIRGFHKALEVLPVSIRLVIIGDGPERDTLEKLAQSCSLGSRIEFVGSVYEQARLAPYFNDSLVSVSPGYIGLSAIHSMAYGVPMLVADKEPHSPEIAAIEDEVNARYFSADDVEELASRLTAFVKEPQISETMGQAARQKVQERFSVGAMAQTFEQAVAYVHRGSH